MKKLKLFIQPLSIAVFLFLFSSACGKNDDQDGDFPSAGTVKDADGNKYNTVKIGTQVWMVENLKTTKYNDGTPIPNVTDSAEWINLTTGAYCNYDNIESNDEIYGRLYNWYAVNTGKLAPKGWHVPSDYEWSILINYLGGYESSGGKLKETGFTHWKSPNYGATNETGFTALPGGSRYRYGTFGKVGDIGYWWSATESDDSLACCRILLYYTNAEISGFGTKDNGCSVRLVKD